jgi:hypothetical protein
MRFTLPTGCVHLSRLCAAFSSFFRRLNCLRSQLAVRRLPLTTVGAITGRNDYSMVGGCAGFNGAQFGAMSDSAFAGFNTECCKVLTPAALGGLGRAQTRALSDDCFWSMSADQIRGFSPPGASGISPAMAKGLPAAACAGLHKEQIALFRDFFTQNVCEQWSAACIAAIAPAEFEGFTQECTQRLRALALANLTAAQVSHFQPTTFFILSANQIAALPPAACSGITSKQMALLDFASPANQCTGLTAACTNQLTADAWLHFVLAIDISSTSSSLHRCQSACAMCMMLMYAILVFSTKLPPRQTSTGVPDLTIHEPEAGYCYRIGCMAALDEYCGKLSRIALNGQETGG